MKIYAYLVISKSGSLRVLKTKPSIKPSELLTELILDVPDSFFTRPVPKIEVEIPKEAVMNPDASSVVRVTAEQVAAVLSLDVNTVEDGLSNMVKAAE